VLVGLILIRFIELVVLELFVLGLDVRLANDGRLQFGEFLSGLLLFGFAVGVLVVVLTVRRGHRLEHRVLTGGMRRHLGDRDFVGPAALLAALAAAPARIRLATRRRRGVDRI